MTRPRPQLSRMFRRFVGAALFVLLVGSTASVGAGYVYGRRSCPSDPARVPTVEHPVPSPTSVQTPQPADSRKPTVSIQAPCPQCPSPTACPAVAQSAEVWISASVPTEVCIRPRPEGWSDECFRTATSQQPRSLKPGKYLVELTRTLPNGQREELTETLAMCDGGRCAVSYNWATHKFEVR